MARPTKANEKVPEPLARKIKAELILQNKNVEYLAAKIGCSSRKVYLLFGDIGSMSIDEYLAICRELRLNALKVFCEYVLFWKWGEQGK